MTKGIKNKNALLLGTGTALLVLSQLRCAVAPLAWVAPVPFLLYLRTTSQWRSRMAFVGVMCLSWILASAKYVTEPLPPVLILFNGLSFGLYYAAAYVSCHRLTRGHRRWMANLGFAGGLVVFEWLLYRALGMGGNTSIGYSQLDNLPYLQTASLFGLAGLSFPIYWFAAVVADFLESRQLNRRELTVVVTLIMAAHIFGSVRIGIPEKTPTTKVAAVTTDWNWWPENPLPTAAEQKETIDALFARSVRAAKAEAKVVVWPEVAAWVDPKNEADILTRGKALAAERGFHLVVSYITPKQIDPLLVENKYVWIKPNGSTHVYLKHKPLLNEPSIPGDGVPKIVDIEFGKASGAICWDADFPHVLRAHAVAGSGLVVLPSADVPGVDPYHTQIAGVRAIEGGYSILRSTRNGLSAGIGPRGRFRGWLSANESNDDILVVSLPTYRVPTLYTLIGDALVWISLAGVLALMGITVVRKMKRPHPG